MARLAKRGEGRWQVLVFRGRDANGKRQFHVKTIKGNKKAALQYAREIEAAISTGSYVEPTKQSVAEFLTTWLDGTASQRLRETYARQLSKTGLHIHRSRYRRKKARSPEASGN